MSSTEDKKPPPTAYTPLNTNEEGEYDMAQSLWHAELYAYWSTLYEASATGGWSEGPFVLGEDLGFP